MSAYLIIAAAFLRTVIGRVHPPLSKLTLLLFFLLLDNLIASGVAVIHHLNRWRVPNGAE
jgi:hypothetical protein